MATPHEPIRVKLFASLIAGEDEIMATAIGRCVGRYGPLDLLSGRLPFDHTDYYRDEMGDGLFRKVVSFDELMAPEQLPSIKRFTNDLEGAFAGRDGRRRINIDPGYLVLDKVVLASCKNFSHRLYLGQGVFGEVTLLYRHGAGYGPLDWTYPDYDSDAMKTVLEDMRKRCRKQLAG